MWIKIVCKRPPQPKRDPRYPVVLTLLPSLAETRVVVVQDDGTETELEGVQSVAWSVEAGNVAMAKVEFVGVEIDAEGIESEPTDKNVEKRLLVTDLCDMNAFHKDASGGRMGKILRQAINYIEGKDCFPMKEAWRGRPLGECCVGGRCDGPSCECPCHPR